MAETRKSVKTVTVGVANTTLEDFSKVAALVGAPTNARISTVGGAVYDPITGEADNAFAYSVTFTWTENV